VLRSGARRNNVSAKKNSANGRRNAKKKRDRSGIAFERDSALLVAEP
jgi:hypothetical protein